MEEDNFEDSIVELPYYRQGSHFCSVLDIDSCCGAVLRTRMLGLKMRPFLPIKSFENASHELLVLS
jgi:hypothetical protein